MSTADIVAALRAQRQQGMTHQQSSGQMDPGWERYMAGKESATRGVPLEAPPIAPDDLIGTGLLSKAGLAVAALMGGIKSVGKKALLKEAPQAEALRLAQQRAALPESQGGLGLRPDNTPEQRAAAMGFSDDRYHGSLYDIEKPSLSRASTESHAGQGFYSTTSPEDASLNYASIYGPDVRAKVERELENIAEDKNIERLHRRYIESDPYSPLSPRQQEVMLANTIGADNMGVVYPLKVRADKPLHLDEANPTAHNVGPFEKHDPEYDDYVELPAAHDLGRALRDYEGRGGDPSGVHDVLADYYGETIPPRLLYKKAEQGAAHGMYDEDGNMLSPGVAAADFVKELGVDQIAHTPRFSNPQLNLGSEHTISLNPDNVRSRFAAFDPWRRNAAIAASMGVAAPDLLAEELRKPQP